MTLTIPQLVIILTLLFVQIILLVFAFWSLRRTTKVLPPIEPVADKADLSELLEKQKERQGRIGEASVEIKPAALAEQVKKYSLSANELSKRLNDKGRVEDPVKYLAESVCGGEELIELLLNALSLANKAQPVVDETGESDSDSQLEQLQAELAEKEQELIAKESQLEELKSAAEASTSGSDERDLAAKVEQLQTELANKEQELNEKESQLVELQNAPTVEASTSEDQGLAEQVEQLQAELAEKDFQLEELRSASTSEEDKTEDQGESEQAEQLRAALAEKEKELEALRNEDITSVSESELEYTQELEEKIEFLRSRLVRWQELLKKAQQAQSEGRIDQTMTELEVQLDELADRMATQAPTAEEQEGIQEQIDLLRAESLFLIAMQSMTPITPKEQ